MIADVAFNLFLSDGYMSTKIIDIAKAAGIGKGTVYEYFDSKESILLYLIENRVATEYSEALETVKNHPGNAEEKLRIYLRIEVSFVMKYGRYIEDLKRQVLQTTTDVAEDIMYAVFSLVQTQFNTIYAIVEDGIKEGVLRDINPKFTTTCITSYVSSYMTATFGMQAFKGTKSEMVETLGQETYNEDELMDIIMHGIGAR